MDIMNTTPLSRDADTTLAAFKAEVQQFSHERDWQQFHSPKNLSMSLAIEAAELMEHFQWISMQDSRELAADPEKKAAIGEELADVFCYTLAIANEMGIDLASTFHHKMNKNREKYPSSEFKGRYGMDDPNPTSA
jgi:NTP pyrophosphatase (non-canonical NTP hydrolase)